MDIPFCLRVEHWSPSLTFVRCARSSRPSGGLRLSWFGFFFFTFSVVSLFTLWLLWLRLVRVVPVKLSRISLCLLRGFFICRFLFVLVAFFFFVCFLFFLVLLLFLFLRLILFGLFGLLLVFVFLSLLLLRLVCVRWLFRSRCSRACLIRLLVWIPLSQMKRLAPSLGLIGRMMLVLYMLVL